MSPSETKQEITLRGGWTVGRAGAKLEQFRAQLSALGEPAAPQPVRLALEGADEIDPCGCQLLALFLVELQRRGFEVAALRLPEPIRQGIERFGFARLIPVQAPGGEG